MRHTWSGALLWVAVGCGGGGGGDGASSLTLGIVFLDSFDSAPLNPDWHYVNLGGTSPPEIINQELATDFDHASALYGRPIDWNALRVSFTFRTVGAQPLAYLIADDDGDLSGGGWLIGFSGGTAGASYLHFDRDSIPRTSGLPLDLGTLGTSYILEVEFDGALIKARIRVKSDPGLVVGELTVGSSFHPKYVGVVLGDNGNEVDGGNEAVSRLSAVDDFKIDVLE